MLSKKTPFILYGGDYNPDQWDEKTVDEDMRLFKQAGVNLLVLPVFSWAKLEPEEGRYEFGWLDKILNKIWESHIYVFLATPTTAQPAWLSKKYDDVLPVDIAGRKRTHGMRVFFCVNSKNYRLRAKKLAEAMADHYKDFEGLAGWHVSNEYGTYCYCENCQKKFRSWLKERYKTIENLNDRWHTSFWGRTVYDFDEIMVPSELNDDYRFSPAIQLDYMRFVTDSTVGCYLNEAKVLKAVTPELPVFTNISGYIKKLNQFEMVPHMDCAGWDNYPAPTDEPAFVALKHDIMRGAKDGASYLVTEQSPNQQNWQPYNKLKRPGQLRLLAYQGMAHGADSSLYFQMRQSIAGQEKFHGAMIAHCGENTRIFKEMCTLGQELKKLGKSFVGGRIQARAAIVFDWDNWWALELTSGPTQDMDYLKQVYKYYKAFHSKNIPVDMVKTTTELSAYDVVVLPLMYMIKPGFDEKIRQFVKDGKTVVATYMSGRADENDRCVFGAYPGPLKDVFGLWVEETDALYPEESVEITMDGWHAYPQEENSSDGMYRGRFLCDIFHTTTARVLGRYGSAYDGEREISCFYSGSPAITCNTYGTGHAYYIGTEMDACFMERFVDEICRQHGVGAPFAVDGQVELTVRESEEGKFLFIINHGSTKGRVYLDKMCSNNCGEGGAQSECSIVFRDLLRDRDATGTFEIGAGDVAVLQLAGGDMAVKLEGMPV